MGVIKSLGNLRLFWNKDVRSIRLAKCNKPNVCDTLRKIIILGRSSIEQHDLKEVTVR